MTKNQIKLNELDKPKLDYAIWLQRAIEYHCRGYYIPTSIKTYCPHHSKLLDKRMDYTRSLENE